MVTGILYGVRSRGLRECGSEEQEGKRKAKAEKKEKAEAKVDAKAKAEEDLKCLRQTLNEDTALKQREPGKDTRGGVFIPVKVNPIWRGFVGIAEDFIDYSECP